MSTKTVLITGASSGIGQATALLLAQKGFRVFGTSRNPSHRQAGSGITMLPLDVRSDVAVQACVDAVMQETDRLDILINNAGYVLAGAVEEASLEQAHDLFETNFFGVLRMVKAVLPLMRQRRSGHIINVGSLVAFTPIPFWGLYNASKSAIEGLTDSLRQDLKPFNIHVSTVEPGFFRSDLGNSTQIGANTIADYDVWRGRAFKRHQEEEENAPDSKIVAETILKIITSKTPGLRHLVGKHAIYYWLGKFMTERMEENGRRNYWNLNVK